MILYIQIVQEEIGLIYVPLDLLVQFVFVIFYNNNYYNNNNNNNNNIIKKLFLIKNRMRL